MKASSFLSIYTKMMKVRSLQREKCLTVGDRTSRCVTKFRGSMVSDNVAIRSTSSVAQEEGKQSPKNTIRGCKK